MDKIILFKTRPAALLRIFIIHAFIVLFLFFYISAKAQAVVWKVGDKVEAGPGNYHPATVLKVSDAKVSFYLHYEDGAYPDGWVQGFLIRARDTQAKADAAAANGPRLGKYRIYGYAGTYAAYNGYFLLKAGGNYEVFNPGDKSIGSGSYNFNKTTVTVKWLSGPFADKDWDGTQKLEVSREGKTYIIRLKARTIGSSSSDVP